eukprot:scaffold67421_cov61-Phaeocystis_antarctica.AAC.1
MRRAIAGGASGAAGRATPDAAAPVLRLHTHSTAAALAADIKGGQGGVGGEGVSGCCFQRWRGRRKWRFRFGWRRQARRLGQWWGRCRGATDGYAGTMRAAD